MFHSWTDNKRGLLNVNQIIEMQDADLCSALPGLHCFTGCDITSSSVRRGMVIPFKTEKYPEYFLSVVEQLIAQVICSQTTVDDLKNMCVACMEKNLLKLVPLILEIVNILNFIINQRVILSLVT